MEVRVVEVPKAQEKREVPFVMGGVYRFIELGGNPSNEFRFLVSVGGKYYMLDANTGAVGNAHDNEEEAHSRGFDDMYEYVPGAYLAIPKEVE